MAVDSTVENSRERDEFNRIKYHQVIEKSRLMLKKYEEGMAHYHGEIEESWYEIGKIDQRLGDK